MTSRLPPTTERTPPGHALREPTLRRLTLVYGPGVRALSYVALTDEPLVIGREPGPGGLALGGTEASRKHARVRYDTHHDLHFVEDCGSKNGTLLDGRPVEGRAALQPGSVLRLGDCILVCSEIPSTLPRLSELATPSGIADRALRLAHADALADRAAPSGLSVLVAGPTGAGKERMAERIHERSRRQGTFVAINCAAFPRDMLASELFGHKKGAFTGAQSDRSGLIVSASGGTLFLDEVAELPLEQQPVLLRVLQEKKVRPVGGERETPVDLRIVAATHRDLAELERAGAFRADLRARLEAVRIALPGLEDRPEDILRLFVDALVDAKPSLADAPTPSALLTVEAAEALLRYPWPTNVREIQAAAHHVALFWDDGWPLPPRALPREVQTAAAPAVAGLPERRTPPTREDLERLLRETQGNVSQVAKRLEAHRTQVVRWLELFGLEAARFR